MYGLIYYTEKNNVNILPPKVSFDKKRSTADKGQPSKRPNQSKIFRTFPRRKTC